MDMETYFRAAFVANCLRGALPPVDLRAVCLVRAIATTHLQLLPNWLLNNVINVRMVWKGWRHNTHSTQFDMTSEGLLRYTHMRHVRGGNFLLNFHPLLTHVCMCIIHGT
jgi:hypothetical protein